MINTIDDAHFESFVSSNQITIVDFWAEWCAPCKLIAPVLDELDSLYKGSISIAKINIDHNNLTPVQYEVRSIPSLLFFKDGKLLGRTVGAVTKQLVIDKLEHFQVL
jgi:thioredoxin 1|tara:strand:+ start:229 stop:549 length:321 start_codon:yes stop_codon:yes gene_type:complete